MNENIQNIILDSWTADVETQRIIKKIHLTPTKFKILFGSKILHYLLDVYNKKTVLGDCPVVFAMLTIFKKYNLSLPEVHHICDTFKLKLIMTLLEHNEIECLTELLNILRENFKGVLKSYMEVQYEIDIGPLNIVNVGEYLLAGEVCTLDVNCNKPDTPTTHDTTTVALEKSHNVSEESDYVKNYVNTSETQEEREIIQSVVTGAILDDFNETNEMFLDIATLEETYTQRYHELLSSSIDVYISIFLDLIFFNKISKSLNELKYLIIDISIYNEDQLAILKQMTESLMLNLIKWKEEVIDNRSNTIHYYDDAIQGDVEQLKVMLTNDDNVQETMDEDLDDIFDF